jgi:hypothetical protein
MVNISSYQEDMIPLFQMIELIFSKKLKIVLLKYIKGYGEKVHLLFTPEFSEHKHFMDILNLSVKTIIGFLSNEYLKKIKRKYFTDDGLSLLIEHLLIEKINAFLEQGKQDAPV